MEPSTVLQQEMSNLLITETVNEQPKVQINSRLPVVPFDQMFPFFTPAIGPDKTNQLQALFDKYKRHEMPGNTFCHLMEDIVGEKLISSATAKLLQQKKTQQVTGDKRPRTEEIHSSKQLVPFHQLFPFLTPHIDSDKANQIQTLADQYERGEIPKHTCVRLMKAILGEQMLGSAMAKVKEQESNQQVAVNEQPGTFDSSEPQLPFDQLALCLVPQIDHDKAIELQTLVHKYQRREVPEYNFLPHMKHILGEQMLRSAGVKLQEHKINPQVTANKKPRIEIHSIKSRVPFDHLFRSLIPQIDVDKAIEVQTLAGKYQRGEIPRHTFFPQMKCIVGEEALSSAAAKLLEQKSKLEITHIGQPGIQVNPSNLKVPLDQLFSSLIPQVDPDKVIELQTLAEKSKRGEIPWYNVVRRMKGIVGEQILRSVAAKVLAEKFNLHVTVHEQPRIQINSSKLVVPSGPPFQSLDPHIDAGKATELQILAYKYKRGEIPKCDLLSHLDGIMGEQILRSAAAKARQQKRISTGSSVTSLYIEV